MERGWCIPAGRLRRRDRVRAGLFVCLPATLLIVMLLEWLCAVAEHGAVPGMLCCSALPNVKYSRELKLKWSRRLVWNVPPQPRAVAAVLWLGKSHAEWTLISPAIVRRSYLKCMHTGWSNRMINSEWDELCLQLIHVSGDFIPQGTFLEINPRSQNNLKDPQGLRLLLSFQRLSWH